MKIGVIGSVKSTSVVIEELYKHSFLAVKIWYLHPKDVLNVSSWQNLGEIAQDLNYNSRPFDKFNDVIDDVIEYKADVLFVVGLSILIPEKVLNYTKIINIGFHPTQLPLGRGRAPIAWLILHKMSGAATFFEMTGGADDGAILEQEGFELLDEDYAHDIEEKLLNAERIALKRLLPKILNGCIEKRIQNDSEATYYGVRKPVDGLIDWNESGDQIVRLIKATSYPHPGAYTYTNLSKLIIWKAEIIHCNYSGVVGRILQTNNNGCFLVQAKDSTIIIKDWVNEDKSWLPKIGSKLGMNLELEILNLKKKLNEIISQFENAVKK